MLEGVALSQHGGIFEIGLKRGPDFVSRRAIPDQLKFRFDNRRNEDTHRLAIGDLVCCKSFFVVVGIRGIGNPSTDVVEGVTEFDPCFEPPLVVRSPRQGVDRRDDGVQRGIGRHFEKKVKIRRRD